jgi:hypothetical protein
MAALSSPLEDSVAVSEIVVMVIIVVLIGSLVIAHVWSEREDTGDIDKNNKKQ